jgi:hypothetical protein
MVVMQWLITQDRDLCQQVTEELPHDIHFSMVVGTVWKSSEIVVQLHMNCGLDCVEK